MDFSEGLNNSSRPRGHYPDWKTSKQCQEAVQLLKHRTFNDYDKTERFINEASRLFFHKRELRDLGDRGHADDFFFGSCNM